MQSDLEVKKNKPSAVTNADFGGYTCAWNPTSWGWKLWSDLVAQIVSDTFVSESLAATLGVETWPLLRSLAVEAVVVVCGAGAP